MAELAWAQAGVRVGTSLEETLSAIPPWFDPAIGVEDLPDAYRGVPLHPEEERMAIVAFYSVEKAKWEFAKSRAMLFGLSAAVIHFNRKPTLAVAVARRLGGVAATAFFDDIARIASRSSEDTDGEFLKIILAGMGSPPSPMKSVPLGHSRVWWIGVKTSLGTCTTEGYYTQTPTEGAVQAVEQGCAKAIGDGVLAKNDAASLRGKANWANAHSAGRCGRIGLGVLQRKQKGEQPELTRADKSSLAFLSLISSRLPARKVWIAGGRSKPVRMYSDASFEPGDTEHGIGWVLFVPGSKPMGRAAKMPECVTTSLRPRKSQIYAAETYAVLAAVHAHLEALRDSDAIFFVDNESACASLIRGSSKEDDVSRIANAVRYLLFSANCRPWFEWVDTHSNCSDGLSRSGISDEWTQKQTWDLDVATVPPWNAVTDLEALAFKTLGYSVLE